MNAALFLQKRSKRHMARMLEQFETIVAPHLDGDRAQRDGERFKAIVRDGIKELANDGIDAVESVASGHEINGAALAIRDTIGASKR